MSFWTEMLDFPYAIEWIDVGGISTRVLRAGNGGEPVLFTHNETGYGEWQ